jgi:hypothetical protein
MGKAGRGTGRRNVEVMDLPLSTPIARAFGLKSAISIALDQIPIGETLFIVPTYTGLLEVHHELEQRGLAAHYWKG